MNIRMIQLACKCELHTQADRSMSFKPVCNYHRGTTPEPVENKQRLPPVALLSKLPDHWACPICLTDNPNHRGPVEVQTCGNCNTQVLAAGRLTEKPLTQECEQATAVQVLRDAREAAQQGRNEDAMGILLGDVCAEALGAEA